MGDESVYVCHRHTPCAAAPRGALAAFVWCASVAAGVTADLAGRLSAVDILRAAVEALGGKGGGGRPDLAQGGAASTENADAAIRAAEAVITGASQ